MLVAVYVFRVRQVFIAKETKVITSLPQNYVAESIQTRIFDSLYVGKGNKAEVYLSAPLVTVT